MVDKNTPIWQLTVGELISIIDNSLKQKSAPKAELDAETKTEYVYGLRGLADLLGCCKNHASKLKNSGIFDEAIIQNGRKIIIDKSKAIELFNKK